LPSRPSWQSRASSRKVTNDPSYTVANPAVRCRYGVRQPRGIPVCRVGCRGGRPWCVSFLWVPVLSDGADLMIALLKWLEPGTRTREQAQKSGKDIKASWVIALGMGMFTITEGKLALTQTGKDELALARTMA